MGRGKAVNDISSLQSEEQTCRSIVWTLMDSNVFLLMDVNVRSTRTSSLSSDGIPPHFVFFLGSFCLFVFWWISFASAISAKKRKTSPSTTSHCDLTVLGIHAVLLRPGIGHSASWGWRTHPTRPPGGHLWQFHLVDHEGVLQKCHARWHV